MMSRMTDAEREAIEAEVSRLGLANGKCWKRGGVWYVGVAVHVASVSAPRISELSWAGSGPCVIDVEVAK